MLFYLKFVVSFRLIIKSILQKQNYIMVLYLLITFILLFSILLYIIIFIYLLCVEIILFKAPQQRDLEFEFFFKVHFGTKQNKTKKNIILFSE